MSTDDDTVPLIGAVLYFGESAAEPFRARPEIDWLAGIDRVVEMTPVEAFDTPSMNTNVDVIVPCPGCTLTIGYWKTHSPYFKDGAMEDPAWDLLAATGHDTAATYQILTTPPKG